MVKEKYRISEETRQNTTRCANEMHCLINGECSDCVIEWVVKGSGMFVRTDLTNNCSYKMAFGDKFICKCPTRFELHMRYGI